MQRANEGGETDCEDVGVDWTLVDVAVDVDADVDGKSRLKLTRRQTWPKPGCRRRFPSESARGADTCLLACPALVRQCCSSVLLVSFSQCKTSRTTARSGAIHSHSGKACHGLVLRH